MAGDQHFPHGDLYTAENPLCSLRMRHQLIANSRPVPFRAPQNFITFKLGLLSGWH